MNDNMKHDQSKKILINYDPPSTDDPMWYDDSPNSYDVPGDPSVWDDDPHVDNGEHP